MEATSGSLPLPPADEAYVPFGDEAPQAESGWIRLGRESEEGFDFADELDAFESDTFADSEEPLAEEAPWTELDSAEDEDQPGEQALELDDEAPWLDPAREDEAATAMPRRVAPYEFYVTIESTKSGKIVGDGAGKHGGKIVGLSFSHQVTSPRDLATGQASGKRRHGPVTMTKRWDGASPPLFRALVNTEQLKSVLFEFVRTNAVGMEMVVDTVLLTNAFISEIKRSAGADRLDLREVEEITFTFQAIAIESKVGKTVAMDDSSEAGHEVEEGGHAAWTAQAAPEPAADLAEGEADLGVEEEGLFERARATLRDVVDASKTGTRIAGGMLDESRLTNLVFFDRHPKLTGTRLSPSDPDFAELSAEWRAIRDQIVRPALVASASAPGAPRGARYDRAGALAYARKFWLRPCDDQFIALASRSGRDFVKVENGAIFEHEFAGGTPQPREHALLADGTQIAWEALDDCTHFISCCIGTRAGEACGGLDISYHQLGSPPHAPYGIVRVGTMVDFLTGRLKGHARSAEIVAEKSEDDSVIDQLRPGDLVAYFHKDRRVYSHMALLLDSNKIACHTYGRSDQPECTWDNTWKLGVGTHQWTFIRFVV